MKIRYIGRKATKADNVAGTGIVWNGEGDVQEVSNPQAAAKLLTYDTVWALAEPEGADAAVLESLANAVKAQQDMVPAEVVRNFLQVMVNAERLMGSEVPAVCQQLGLDPNTITVPVARTEAPAAAPPSNDTPPAAQDAPSPQPTPPADPAAAPPAGKVKGSKG